MGDVPLPPEGEEPLYAQVRQDLHVWGKDVLELVYHNINYFCLQVTPGNIDYVAKAINEAVTKFQQ